MIEKGRPIEKRVCPKRTTNVCVGCKPCLLYTSINLFCKKSDTARQYVNRWLPIVAAAQLTKKKAKEKDFLMKWIDVVEYV